MISLCPLCNIHGDGQFQSLECPKILTEISVQDYYEELFKSRIPLSLLEILFFFKIRARDKVTEKNKNYMKKIKKRNS